MYKVVKRNGSLADFDIKKIIAAITKAFDAVGREHHESVIELIALRVTADFDPKVKDEKITVEEIQDSVEKVLSDAGYADVAKAYILYRQKHADNRRAEATLLNYQELMDKYLKVADWRVKENSTVTYSVGGLILSNSGAVTANYWLSQVYDKDVEEAHRNADIHLHDLSMLTGYCAGWSLRQLIEEGLGGVTGRITSAPARHLSTLCNQMVNFLGIMQNEWAGAQAFSSFDTYLAPFVKIDNLTQKEVEQCIQSFVYGVNTPSRWGTQAPFSNITLDWVVPNDMKNLPAVVGGKKMDFTYGDCQKEMDMVNKAFIETMIKGDANGRGFQYPIPTYSITRDFDWSETENNKLLFEMTAKYGTPYFSNYINSDMEPSDVRSMCPLFKNEKVLVRDDYSGEFHISTVENLYKGHKKEKTYDVILNGKAKKASLHRFDGLTFYKIRTVNGTEVIFSGNHENLVYGGAVKTTDQLTTNDYLPFNITPIEGSGLTYEDGLMVGAFLGDGSLKDDYTVVYSLNNTTKQSLAGEITRIAKERFGAKMRETQVSEHCINFNITSQMLRGLIEEYVSGKALEKELNAKCIGRSKAFRAGIADGYQATDGSDNKRIYSASKKAIESVAALYTSLGYATNIAVDTRDGKETYSYNPVYCIRPYAHNTTHRSNVYINENGYMWFRIESVEKVDTDSQIGYCFEVLGDEEPYFTLPSGLVTHNCRLRLDLRELRKKSGGFFGSGESTGSIGVVTINMPRIGYLAKDEADFYKRLDRLMDIAARSLKTKRTAITKYMEDGLYPYTKRYLGTFENHFSTIGLVGMNEACLNANWIREDMSHEKAQKFTKDVLNHMRERLSDYQELYGDLYNLEATPAESTAYRFAKHDKEKYPDIITANMSGDPYYTNSSHLPVGFTEDIFSALDIQDELQTLYTSGTVFHAFLGEKLPSWRSAAALVRKIAENYRLPYYTISPTYSVCKDHGYLSGEQAVCPYCGKETEIYSRITGYYRPIANWNAGKKSEWMERRPYAVSSSCLKSSKRLICTTLNGTESTTSNETARATKVNAGMAAGANTDTKTAPTAKESEVMLFKTPTCPNCKTAMTFLQKAGVKYQIVDAEDAGNRELVDKFGIRQAPTLIVEKDGKVEKLRGVSEIAGWLKNAANQ